MVLLSHLVPFAIGLYYRWKSLQKWFILIAIDITVFRLVTHTFRDVARGEPREPRLPPFVNREV